VGWIQNLLEAIQVSTGLPWWGTIVVATLTVRTLMLPFVLNQLRNAARLNNIRPQMEVFYLILD